MSDDEFDVSDDFAAPSDVDESFGDGYDSDLPKVRGLSFIWANF